MFETLQSKLVLVATLIILLLNVLFNYMSRDTNTANMVLVVAIIIGIPLALLFAYDINCLVIGKCTVWSWIRTLIYLIMVILIVVAVIMEVVKRNIPKKKDEETKSSA